MSLDMLGPRQIKINDYLIDASYAEEHTFDSDATEYPVENGSPITDNVRPKPVMVTIEGVVSDTPIKAAADARQAEQLAATVLSPQTQQVGQPVNYLPSDEALARLLAIRDARQPVTIQTSLKTFDKMVMIGLAVPRDPETGYSLKFTARFQQITVVTNNRIAVRTSPPGNGASLGPKVNSRLIPTSLRLPDSAGMVYFKPSAANTVAGGSFTDAKGNTLTQAQFTKSIHNAGTTPVRYVGNPPRAIPIDAKSPTVFKDTGLARIAPIP